MTTSVGPPAEPLLDPPPLSLMEVRDVERLLTDTIDTSSDIVLVPSEATLALQATAASLGGAGIKALNLVSGPYGRLFGQWLRRAGTDVVDLMVPFDRAVHPADVEAALHRRRVDLVSLAHAEAATGVVNDLAAITEVVHRHGALAIVDAVASLGVEPLLIDDWAIDLCVVGAEKAWAGPVGVSVVLVREVAWGAMLRPGRLRPPISLLDWSPGRVAAERRRVPVQLPILETRALAAATRRIASEGPSAVVDRHRRAAGATRAGGIALGLDPWVADATEAAGVATLLHPPIGTTPDELVAAARGRDPTGVVVEVAPADLSGLAVRIGHTGRRASLPTVLTTLAALASALRSDPNTALEGATEAWSTATDLGPVMTGTTTRRLRVTTSTLAEWLGSPAPADEDI